MNIWFSPHRAPRAPRLPWRASAFVALLLVVAGFGHACNVALAAPGDISRVAGTGVAPGAVGDGSPATSVALDSPSSIAFDASGNFYIADASDYRVRKVTSAGIISTLAGTGTAGFNGDGGQATNARLNLPNGVAVDGGGNVYIADTFNHRIRKVTPAGIISTVAGDGTAGSGGDGGVATSAQLNNPYGVATDASGNLYIADASNYRVRKVTSAGIISTVAGTGTSGFGGDGGPATAAQLNLLFDVTLDARGNLYIADSRNNRIRKVTPAGIISTVAGTSTADFGGDGGAATSAQLNNPNGIAVDGGGNLYIADADNNRVRKVTPAGIISTVAGDGTAGFRGDGGAATAAQLRGPYDVAVNGIDLLIADSGNRFIRKVEGIAAPPNTAPIASATTLTGTQGNAFSGQLIASDADGNALTYFLAGALPGGLSLNSATGVVSGTPTERGVFNLTFKVNDGTADSNVANVTITITETPSLVVNTLADNSTNVDGLTSLREAIARANTDDVASEITFRETEFAAPRKTITLNGTALPNFVGNGTLTISAPAAGVEISGNNASRVFLVNPDADVTLTGLTIRDGNAGSNEGGGIFNKGKLTLDSCTLTGNRARLGGALYSQTDLSGLTLTLRNCTLSGNTATTRGGGLRNFSGLSVIESCTIAGNQAAAGAGGGVASVGDTATRTEVRNSIIAGNTGSDVSMVGGTTNSFQSGGYNLIGVGDSTSAFNANGDVINNTAPGVAALDDNLGRVPTRALLAGSPAINAGDPAFDGAGKFDARGEGFARVRGGRLDIGAFEVQNLPPTVAPTIAPANPTTNQTLTVTPGGNDADGDTLTYVYTFLVNDVEKQSGANATFDLIVAGQGDKGDIIKVSVVANDGKVNSAPVTAQVTVANSAPTASVALSSKAPKTGDTLTATATASDADAGDTLSYAFVWKVTRGGQTTTVKTTPASSKTTDTLDLSVDGNGDKGDVVSVEVEVTDQSGASSGVQSDSATVANSAPVATAQNLIKDSHVLLQGQLSATDADADDKFTFAKASDPAHGKVTVKSDGSFVYTAEAGFVGADSFGFVANDGTDDSAEATISIDVQVPNYAPVLNSATFSISLNAPFSAQLAATDADGDTISYVLANGTSLPAGLNFTSRGLISGTPTVAGRTNFSVRVSDKFGGTSVSDFIIIVSDASDGTGPIIARDKLSSPTTREALASSSLTGTIRDIAKRGVTPSGVRRLLVQLRNSSGQTYSGARDGFTADTNRGYFAATLGASSNGKTSGTRSFSRDLSWIPANLAPGNYTLNVVGQDVAGNLSVEVVPLTIVAPVEKLQSPSSAQAATSPAPAAVRSGSGGNS